MIRPAVSHHLRPLKNSGLVVSRRVGKEVYYHAADTEQGRLLHQMIEQVMEITSLAGNEQTESIFSAFFNLPENLQFPYWKLKALELLLYLLRLETDSSHRLTEYQAEQIKIIRSIYEQLVGNLNQRFSIESLSKQYLMNATTLKKLLTAARSFLKFRLIYIFLKS